MVVLTIQKFKLLLPLCLGFTPDLSRLINKPKFSEISHMVLSPIPREFNFLEWVWLGEILYSLAYPSNAIPWVTCSCPNCHSVSTELWLGEGLEPHGDREDGGWTLIATAYCDCLAALQNLQHNSFFFVAQKWIWCQNHSLVGNNQTYSETSVRVTALAVGSAVLSIVNATFSFKKLMWLTLLLGIILHS